MDTLDVIFRKDKQDGDVTAVFPSLPGASENEFTAYAHIGQHGAARAGWYYLRTRPATPEEYAPLLAELRSIYEQHRRRGGLARSRDGLADPERVTLRVVQRMTRRHAAQREEAACR